MDYAAELLNRVVGGVDGLRIGLHVCRGNWSRDESVLLAGDYAPLVPAFARMDVGQLVLEFATPRAGELDDVGRALGHKEIGLGVVNPRTAEVESVASIVERVEHALQFYPPAQIFLNPDCGFGTFASRPIADADTAAAKLRRMVESAARLRDRYA